MRVSERTAHGLEARVTGEVLAIPIWVIVGVCCLAPMAWLGWEILSRPAVFGEAVWNWFRLRLLVRTIVYNGMVAGIAVTIALPAEMVLGRGRGWLPRVLFFVLPVSLLLPSLTYAYGWSQFLRLMDATPEPGSRADVMRCVWSLATWLWPIPAAAVGLTLRRMDTQVQQQALLDGALWRVTGRQLVPAIVASAAVVFVLAVQEFSVYEPTGISVVATEVRMVFETGAMSSRTNPITAVGIAGQGMALGPSDQGERAAAAAATGLPLLIVIAVIALTMAVIVRRSASEEEVEVAAWPGVLDAGAVERLLAVLIVLVAVGVPTMSMILSLKAKLDPVRLWEEFAPQISGSLVIAGMTGVVAAAISFWATVRKSLWSLTLAACAFLVGGQLLAIALIRLYNRPGLTWAYNGPAIMLAVYLARFCWIALLAGMVTWSRPWRILRDLAALDGAGAVRTAASVLFPVVWPVLAAAGVLIMALSLVEVPATVLISPQRPQMMTPLMMTWVHMLRYDAMIEASLMMMVVVGALGVCVAGLIAIAKRQAMMRRWAALPALLIFVGLGCSDHSSPKAIWCSTGTGPAQVVYPRAISYCATDDSFFVIDRMARVQHLDDAGNCLAEWQMPEWQQGKPVGVTVGPDGNVYVPDTHYHRVMVYSGKGELLRQWGKKGTSAGEFIYPTDIAFDSKGRIFVSEYGDNDRVQVFDASGKWLYAFGKFGSGDGEFSRPQSMVIDGDLLYLTDACNHRLQVWKTDGTWVRNIGHVGSGPGEFRFPYGLDEDREGNLIVCEFGNNRVQKIEKATGRCLGVWGTGGHEPGQLAYPWGVAVDKKNRVVAVDAGNNRLQVFGF